MRPVNRLRRPNDPEVAVQEFIRVAHRPDSAEKGERYFLHARMRVPTTTANPNGLFLKGIHPDANPERSAMLTKLYHSPIGKKVVTGITGIALTLFVLVHMTGNLAFFADETGEAYNRYSHFLTHQLGLLFYAIEIVLLLIFALHLSIGLNIWLGKRRARRRNYDTYRTAGGPSRQTLSSRSMVLTGVILLAFTVWHLVSFKYGTYYEVTYDGVGTIRDIALLVRQRFMTPLYGIGYPAVMLLLAFHLRHGIWSAFQSLGAVRPAATPAVYGTGTLVGIAIGIGFLVLPLAIFFQFV